MGEKCNICRLNDTWVDGRCVNLRCSSGREDRLYDAILLEFLGVHEAWSCSNESTDAMARSAARVAARVVGTELN